MSITNHFSRMDAQDTEHYRWTSALDLMAQFHYREEDQFREATNAQRLKELYECRDFTGLLEFALLLNHEASFNNSKVRWALSEALEVTMPVSDRHLQMANDTISELAKRMLDRARESGGGIF